MLLSDCNFFYAFFLFGCTGPRGCLRLEQERDGTELRVGVPRQGHVSGLKCHLTCLGCSEDRGPEALGGWGVGGGQGVVGPWQTLVPTWRHGAATLVGTQWPTACAGLPRNRGGILQPGDPHKPLLPAFGK